MKKQPAIIKFEDINLRFKNKTIFHNFNFSILKGEKVVIFGTSGSGKSTLLNLLLGFIQPQEGKIFFNSQEITAQNIWQVRRQIAYVDQDVMMGKGEVQKIINEYFSFSANAKKRFTQIEIEKLLHDFRLDSSLLTKNIDQLSGGERQRLALVIAILLKRPVMVLDEVTSALDPISKTTVISQLLKNKQVTVLIITHDKEWQHQKTVRIFDFKEKKWTQ